LTPGHALLDAALEHQVFHEAADGIVGERGDDGGVEAEAPLQPAGDVVLSAALPDLERARGVTRRLPGSSRSMTSPRATQSHRHESADLSFSSGMGRED
jgi:hypothetical protein